ncbi:hypothetical protein DFH07DRAFT_784769 [Mycena maculata]|uniref:AMP-dependent synthetase/ligase domain-containing protein n=1 Tax=Mycena maculata TaxID=230809 RepID=A0AAD7HEL4_9AGAR|nr:hypothetical protein DFH07DRAFT_784769 [Mycena maculata]
MYPQGVNSATFSAGPLDGSLTIPQLLDRHLECSPDHPAYIYDDPKGNIVSIKFSQYIRAVHAAARLFLRDNLQYSRDGGATVVALFATTGMMVAGAMRAGMVPFCISPRNAAASLANLLKEVKVAAVYVSSDLRSVLSEGIRIYGCSVLVFDAPTFAKLQVETDVELSSEMLPPIPVASIALDSQNERNAESMAFRFNLNILDASLANPWFSTEDHCGQILGCHALPNFHGIGVLMQTWPITSELVVAVLRPTTPPIRPTAENSLKAMIATEPSLVLATPANIETWSEDPIGLKFMQSLKTLSYIGATLNKCSHGKDWDYISMREGCNIVRVPEDDGPGLYTHTYLVGPAFATTFTNAEIDGKPGCSLSDLLEQHPENPELHRVYGRKDDLIAFSTAAKVPGQT